jgi:hypothetical protein
VIIVHAKLFGAIDLTARMVAKVARKFTETPLVIENRYGGSGAVAMRAVRGKKPDGYHLLAFPATFISTIKVARSKIDMADYRFLACMVEAPEALITNRNSDVVTIEDIVRDAKAKQGEQIWVGPGVGSLEGVAAPAAAAGGSVGGALVPLLTLGIPGSAATAVLVGALMLHGITPGPELFAGKNSYLVYGLFASLVLGNAILLVLGVMGNRLWVKIISAPKALLFPVILVLAVLSFAMPFVRARKQKRAAAADRDVS